MCWNWQTGTFEGRVSNDVRVQVPSLAPNQYNPNLFPIGDGFGFIVFFDRYEATHFRNGLERKPTSKPRAQGRRSRPHNAKRAGAAVFTVRPPFSSRLRFGLRLLRLPLLLPFGKLPLALLALVESENVRQKAVDNRPPSPVPQWSSGLLSPSPL